MAPRLRRWFSQCTLSLCMVLPLRQCAQSTGMLRLVVDPGDKFEFIVDDTLRLQVRNVELPAGNHSFLFYSPGYSLLDTQLAVIPGLSVDALIRMRTAAGYVAYLRDMGRYRSEQLRLKRLPAFATAGAACATLFWLIKLRKANALLDEDLTSYNNSFDPGFITELKQETIPDHQALAHTATWGMVASGALFGAGLYWTIKRYAAAGRLPVPVYDDQERLKFDGLTFIPPSDDELRAWQLHVRFIMP